MHVYQSSSNRGLWDPLMRVSVICTTHSTGEWTETEDGVFLCVFYYAFSHSLIPFSLSLLLSVLKMYLHNDVLPKLKQDRQMIIQTKSVFYVSKENVRGACPYKSTIEQNSILVKTFSPHNIDKCRPAHRNRQKAPCCLPPADSVWQPVKCVCVSCTFRLSCQKTSAPSLTACNFEVSLSRQASVCGSCSEI